MNPPASELTARDYFAAAALTGLLAYSPQDSDVEGQLGYREAVEEAYRYAEMMLMVRQTPAGPPETT